MPRGDNNRKLSDAQRDAIATSYTTPDEQGRYVGTPQLARRYDVSVSTIKNVLRSRGVEMRGRKEAQSNRCRPAPPDRGSPFCACGCGTSVRWRGHGKGWAVYAPGHYRRQSPYKSEDWLLQQYEQRGRSVPEIAATCEVSRNAVMKYMRRFGISRRDGSAAHIGRQTGPANPAWKGGVAQWPYASDWKAISRQIR